MTYLRYTNENQVSFDRAENDPEIIAELTRKGWVEVPAPTPSPVPPRQAARAQLRNAWGALASWIRGPFHTQFLAVQDLLDKGDDAAAEALIAYAQPPADYAADDANGTAAAKQSAFATFKAEFTAAIAALPSL